VEEKNAKETDQNLSKCVGGRKGIRKRRAIKKQGDLPPIPLFFEVRLKQKNEKQRGRRMGKEREK